MTFTEVFGGTTIYPSGVSYRAVALSANQTLAWPVETATSGNVVAQIMDVTPSAGSLSIIMPPANEASVGETTLFFNPGAFTFTVKDNGGNTIVAIAPGLSYQVYLIGNSTVNGTWRSTQYAAGTSSATAGSLVGAGIKAISTTLNQSMSVTTLNSNYAIGDADRSEAFVWTGGAGALTLPGSGTVGNDWFCHIRNGGTGAITLTPTGSELINGTPNLTFNPGDSAIVICDGTSFFTIGFGQSVAFAFDYVSIDLSSPVTSPYTLSGANLNRIAYSFGGTLTANMQVLIPATIQQYWISNDTSGAFSLTVKVAGQVGVVIPQGSRGIYYCNGTDIIDADTSSFAFPLTVAQGGTGATTESGARINLGGTSVGIGVFTAATAADGRVALSAAKSGANSDITSLTGLTTPLSVGQGGTGTATAFTAGSVVFGGVSGVYSQDNANLFWDDTNNRLGIGTASPVSRLNIIGDQILAGAAGTATLGLQIKGPAISAIPSAQVQGYIATGDSSMGVAGDLLIAPRTDATANVRFITGTAPTERMRITAAGDVGVGTVSPNYKLEVRTDAVSGFNWVGSFNNAATGSFGAGFLARSSVGSAYFYMRGDGLAYVENATNNALGFATNATEKMRITAAGDVGVGITTPITRIHAYNNTANIPVIVRTQQASTGNSFDYASFSVNATGASGGIVAWATGSLRAGQVWVQSDGTQPLVLGTNDTERMRITSTGDVGIGTASPQSKFHVSGGYITAGNVSSTAGSKIIGGDYSGAEHITTFGSEFSSGGPVVGYGVWPSTSAALAFVSSASVALQRAAYTQTGNNHVWFTGASQTAAVGSAVTMTERMRMDGSGNLGLGTAPSGVRMDVNGSIRTTVGSGGTLSLFETDAVRANQLFSGADASGSFINATFSTGGTAVLRLQTANNERMRIDSVGDVGIGTNTPSTYVVSSDRTLVVAGSAFSSLNLVCGGAFGGAGLTVDSSANLQFRNAGSERMRITSGGNLLVGTTTALSGTRVVVSGGMHAQAVAANGTPDGYADGGGLMLSYAGGIGSVRAYANASGTGSSIINFLTAGTERMRVKAEGQVRFVPLAAAPSGAEAGDVYYDSTTNKLRCYNGTIWNDLF
jgi:hypothetical protein